MIREQNDLRALTWSGLVLLFGIPTVLNGLAFWVVLPAIDATGTVPIEVAYFLSVGGLVLAPMFFGAVYLSGREIGSYRFGTLADRLRLRRLSRGDWLWTIGGFIGLCLASIVIADWVMPALGADSKPFFFENMPLASEDRWIIAVWPAFFFFNIFGEELLWRGYLVSLPIFFVLPAIVQHRKNTTISILIHTVFGALGFLFLAFGLVD